MSYFRIVKQYTNEELLYYTGGIDRPGFSAQEIQAKLFPSLREAQFLSTKLILKGIKWPRTGEASWAQGFGISPEDVSFVKIQEVETNILGAVNA